MSLLSFLSADTVHDLGWTLLHFLWQGILLAAVLELALCFTRGARARHDWALAALLLMLLAPVATFFVLHGWGAPEAKGAALTVPAGTGAPLEMIAGAAAPSPWINWLVLCWFAGIAALSLRALGGWVLVETLRRQGTASLPADLLERCHALQRQLGVTRPIRFLQSLRVTMPVVVGWLRPVILIPAAALSGLPPQQLDALILHELAHIRRHDALINALLLAAETLLFYHPAIWWVSRRIRIEREHCCDDLAVARCGDAALYVEALATLEAGRLPPGLALAAGVRLKDRAARLLGAPSQTRRHSLGAITGLAAVALVAVSVAVAQPGAPAQAVAQMDFLQITDDKGMQPPIEINADKISHDTRGRPTIFFDGHVTIQQGGITIRADNGESPDGMRTRLLVSGHVVLTQNGKTVKSDHLEIDVSDRTLRLAGQHRVTVSPAMIPAPAQGNAAIGIEGSTNSRDGLVTKITGLQITDDKGAQPPITIHADNVRNDAQGRPTQFEGNAIVQQGGITVRANSIRAEVASAAPPSGGKLTRLIADGDVVVTQDGKTVRTTHLEADVRDNKLAISLSGGVQLELH